MDSKLVHGTIIGRRSMGRNLAFADVLPRDRSPSMKIMFVRQSFLEPSRQHQLPNDTTLQLDEPFPTKKSSIPYGARITAELIQCKNADDRVRWEVTRWKIVEHPKELAERLASLEMGEPEKRASSTIDASDDTANINKQPQHEENTTQKVIMGSGAMSCSKYLKARGEAFARANQYKVQLDESVTVADDAKNYNRVEENKETKQPATINDATPANDVDADMESEVGHGGKQAKAKRSKIFASWILETFFGVPMPLPNLTENVDGLVEDVYCKTCATDDNDTSIPTNAHVLDVAGGKGQLSVELMVQQMLPYESVCDVLISKCTIIDPLVRKGDAKQRKAKLRRARSHVHWLRQQQCVRNDADTDQDSESTERGRADPTITHLATYFTSQTFEEMQSNFTSTQDNSGSPQPTKLLLLGLHPDQCTEDILDVAIKHNLPVAIVPCCVYPDFFPSRRSSSNTPVRTYSEFLQFLMDKDERLQMTTLPFEGKNIVIYKTL